ncbi:capZ-interacting protein isoform X2 [Mustela lutreola]|uniref:capZ-interacting protein isoform X2 n=1 Tax=Mustela lutreola TaxID=9666 RepID=UPI0027971EBD|nr:capZ-interacting protein isoform X2 [Mustela lutreola]
MKIGKGSRGSHAERWRLGGKSSRLRDAAACGVSHSHARMPGTPGVTWTPPCLSHEEVARQGGKEKRAGPPAVPSQAAARRRPSPSRARGAEPSAQRARPPRSRHLEAMEERPAEARATVDDSAPPSVAQLAGRFREQAAAAKETPACKPTRRKPPCSLPLFPPKVELGQNGEEKSPPSASHPPKIKVKSSPLIEKLQANLAFDPTALLPGASPKSPGLKAVVSPFQSPPSTPSSPGVRSQEPEDVPVSFDQPPEGSRLPCFNKVRTKGSIKRRPPSRRFRRSQSDCGDLADLRAPASSQENGAKEENGDEVFPPHSEALGSPPPGEGPAGAREKPPLRRTSSRAERQEKGQAVDDAQPPQKAVGGSDEEASPRPATGEAVPPGQASNPEAENGRRSPTEGKEETEKREAKEATAAKEDEEPRQSRDAAGSAEGAAGEAPAGPPRGAEVPHIPEQGKGEEKDEAGAVLEPGCCPSEEAPETEDNPPVQDTKM